jgi:hypothetical protein
MENKRLTAFSNRNSNDSRKLATLSKSTTSNFLIATKLHVSEQKAKPLSRRSANQNPSGEDAYSKEHIPEQKLYRRRVIH